MALATADSRAKSNSHDKRPGGSLTEARREPPAVTLQGGREGETLNAHVAPPTR
jgi:hypothetical protein